MNWAYLKRGIILEEHNMKDGLILKEHNMKNELSVSENKNNYRRT